MKTTSRALAALTLTLLACADLPAQLNGIYTCAAGNPGNAFDYGDIGDFITAVNGQGLSGPVTLDVYDDGGPFVSTASYLLGGNGYWSSVGPTRPLTIRAATGELPVVAGSGANMVLLGTGVNLAAMTLREPSHTTIDGLTFSGAANCGIYCFGPSSPSWTLSGVRIANCRIHSVSDGLGICFYSPILEGINSVVIENNMLWNCRGKFGLSSGPRGVICAWGVGLEWIVRHNTIVHRQAQQDTVGYWFAFGEPLEQFVGNVIDIDSSVPQPNEIYSIGMELRGLQCLSCCGNSPVWRRRLGSMAGCWQGCQRPAGRPVACECQPGPNGSASPSRLAVYRLGAARHGDT